MIGDNEFNTTRLDKQKARFDRYLEELTDAAKPEHPRIVVIEVGAGITNPLLRTVSESLVRSSHGAGFLIRINPGEMESIVPKDIAGVGLRLNGERAMTLIDKQIKVGERMLEVEDLHTDIST